MLGFVVKNIDLSNAILNIDIIHSRKFSSKIVRKITSVQRTSNYHMCESSYSGGLTLSHIFYKLSSIIS